MATTSSGQAPPSFGVHSIDFTGILSPTLRLNWAATVDGRMAPARLRFSAAMSAGGIVSSGLVAANASGSTAKPRKLMPCGVGVRKPPWKMTTGDALLTPGVARICGSCAIGSGSSWLILLAVISTSAWVAATVVPSPEMKPCSRP